MSVEAIVARLPYRLGYKSQEQRAELMQRRQANISWALERGHTVSFGSYLLADCSPFTEWCWRNMQGTRP